MAVTSQWTRRAGPVLPFFLFRPAKRPAAASFDAMALRFLLRGQALVGVARRNGGISVVSCRRLGFASDLGAHRKAATTSRRARPRGAVERDEAWHRIAAKVQDGDYEGAADSKYVRRVRESQRFDVKGHVEKLEEELLEEMAEALGRTVSRCDHAFAMLDVAMAEYAAAQSASEQESALRSLVMLRREAMERRTALMIHRQALGFRIRNEAEVRRFYPLPDLPAAAALMRSEDES